MYGSQSGKYRNGKMNDHKDHRFFRDLKEKERAHIKERSKLDEASMKILQMLKRDPNNYDENNRTV